MNVDIRDHDIRIKTDKETAAELGARYIKDSTFQLPKTIDAVKDLMKFSNNIELKALHERMKKAQTALLHLKNRDDIELSGFERLRPYQRVDVNFLSKLPNALVANEMRTGKSPTSLSVFEYEERKKNCIVCPASLVKNWEKEVKTWTTKTPFPVSGSKKKREKIYEEYRKAKEGYLIISYETLRMDVDMLNDVFDGMIVDEAHRIRGRKSQQTLAVKRVGKNAKKRLALTGTPSVKSGYDVWSVLNFLYEDKFSSYWGFLDRYFELKKDFWSGTLQPTGKYTRQEELENMLALFSTNRKRKDVMDWLPDKTYQTIPIELTPKQRKAYESVLESFRYEEEGETKVDASGVLPQLIRLRQICLAPSMLDIKAPSAKEEFLLEWLQDNKEPVIIFSMFTSYLTELHETLEENLKEKVVMIHGQLTSKQKQESVEHFQQGKTRILLANIEAAGVGYTLDRASTTIFLDKEWNPTDNLQAEDRMVPVSKERNHKMTVISLVAADTVDEKVDKLLEHKYNIIEVVNSGGLRALDRLYKELNGQWAGH